MKKNQSDLKTEDKLKEIVLLHFNGNINNTNDAIKLSESIYKVTKKSINYNTIRRFFNIVPSKSKPSIYTLDALAEYVGQKNWSTFYNNLLVSDHNLMLDFSIFTNAAKKTNFDKLIELDNRFGSSHDFLNFLRNVITASYHNNDYIFFKRIFELKKAFHYTDERYLEISYTISLLGTYVSQSDKLKEIAIKHYFKLPYSINYYVEYYVDLDNINGYYGLLLDKYIKHKKNDTQASLFYNSMKFYGCYLAGDFKNYEKYLKTINAIKKFDGIYSIPIARMRVCQAIYSYYKAKSLPEFFVDELKNDLKYIGLRINFMIQIVDYIVHIAQGLFWLKEYELIKLIVEEYLPVKKLEVTNENIANSKWNHLKIYYSVALFYFGNKIHAKKYFKSVNEMLFEAKQFKIITKEYTLAEKIIVVNSKK